MISSLTAGCLPGFFNATLKYNHFKHVANISYLGRLNLTSAKMELLSQTLKEQYQQKDDDPMFGLIAVHHKRRPESRSR